MKRNLLRSEEKLRNHIGFNCDDKIMFRIHDEAESKDMTVSDYLRWCVDKIFKAEDMRR